MFFKGSSWLKDKKEKEKENLNNAELITVMEFEKTLSAM